MKENVIKQLAKKYDLMASLIYKYNTSDESIERKYWFENSPESLERLFADDDFKQLEMKPEVMAYTLFCMLDIEYSHENEFFID